MITKFMKIFCDKRFIIGERNCNTVYLSDKYKDPYALIKIRVNDVCVCVCVCVRARARACACSTMYYVYHACFISLLLEIYRKKCLYTMDVQR